MATYAAGVGAALTLGAAGLLTFGGETVYNYIIMPLTRLMDPEKAHRVAVRVASLGFVPTQRDTVEDRHILVR